MGRSSGSAAVTRSLLKILVRVPIDFRSTTEWLMATIRASCEKCGDVELPASAVSVRVCRDDNAGSYTFTCPECASLIAKPAEPRIVELLVVSGVRLVTWDLPAELNERDNNAKPIDHDDLLDFHSLLKRDDWFEDLHRFSSN